MSITRIHSCDILAVISVCCYITIVLAVTCQGLKPVPLGCHPQESAMMRLTLANGLLGANLSDVIHDRRTWFGSTRLTV
jgi:hypothetical protein